MIVVYTEKKKNWGTSDKKYLPPRLCSSRPLGKINKYRPRTDNMKINIYKKEKRKKKKQNKNKITY
jgi:hypothetical protein